MDWTTLAAAALTEWLIAGLGVGVTVVVWAFLARARRETDGSEPVGHVRRIRVDGAYHPSTVHIPSGEPARLIFYREDSAPCSERIVLPDFGVSMYLPPFEEVAVDVPPSGPGDYEFTCHMHMLEGRLVVDPGEREREAASR